MQRPTPFVYQDLVALDTVEACREADKPKSPQ